VKEKNKTKTVRTESGADSGWKLSNATWKCSHSRYTWLTVSICWSQWRRTIWTVGLSEEFFGWIICYVISEYGIKKIWYHTCWEWDWENESFSLSFFYFRKCKVT
jgi:hypothetical protein